MTQHSTRWTKRPEGSGVKKGGKLTRRFYQGLDSPGWSLKAKAQAAIDAEKVDLIKAIASLLNACAATKPTPAVTVAEPAPVSTLASVPTEDLEALLAADKAKDPA